MTDTDGENGSSPGDHAGLGRFTALSLLGATALWTMYYAGREMGFLSTIQRSVVSLLAVGLLALSARHVIRQVYHMPTIKRLVGLATFLLILAELGHLLRKVAVAQGMPLTQWFAIVMTHTAAVSLYVGILLLFASFFSCILETEAAKRRLARETEELVKEIEERKRIEQVAHGSEEKTRLILESIEDGYYEVNLNGDFTSFNDADCRILGYTPGEMMGMNNREYMDEKNAEAVYATFNEVYRTGNPTKAFDWRLIRKDGSTCVVEASISLVRDAAGEPAGFRGIMRDITDRKRAEANLRKSEEKFRVLAETSTAATFIHQGGHYRYMNPAAEAITGYSREELFHMDFWEFVHPDFQDLVRERGVARLHGEHPAARYELAIVTKDGKKRWIDLTVGVIDFEGEPAVLGAFFDTTERRNAEKERLALERQIQRAQKLESLGVLAGGIAHDFNNLLMGVLGNADLALMDMSPVSPVRENLKAIETAAKRAADLARQMLAYSGKGRFVVEPIDIGEVAKEIGHLLVASISKKAVLKFNLPENLPAIEADATQMRQIVMNLVTNASEALGDEEGIVSITTGVRDCDQGYLGGMFLDEGLPSGRYVFIEVADTGCGMDTATCANVFDPFFTTKFTGRGLGLAAALGIVRGHKGAVKVSSEPGRGTTFTVLFPALSHSAVQAGPGADGAAEWRGSGAVLLVDDDEAVRQVGQRMLEKMGFTVVPAGDGRDAVKIFREHEADFVCVLLDLTMPHMDGEETFRELRRIRGDVRVILSSGYNEQEVVNRFPGKVLAGFIQKPYQAAALMETMRDVLDPAPVPKEEGV